MTSLDAQPRVTGFVHVGHVVEHLDETVRFLTVLGFDCSAPSVHSGDWIGRIIGLEDVTVELVMVRLPDGDDVFEVVRFHAPAASAREPAPGPNRPGSGTSPSRWTTCAASWTASGRPAGTRSGRSWTTRGCSSSATSAGRGPDRRADRAARSREALTARRTRAGTGHAAWCPP